jgi:ubiquitin-protein ligase
MLTQRRIKKDYDDLDDWRYADIRQITKKVGRRNLISTVNNSALFDVYIDETNIYKWIVKIQKPTIDNEFIEVIVNFPDNYPFTPPKFISISDIYHPCIGSDGKIDIMNGMNWSPAFTVGACLLIITSTLFPDWEEEISSSRQRWRSDQIKMELIEKTAPFNF